MAQRVDREFGVDEPRPVAPAVIEAAARGDEEAWRLIFDDYYPRIYRLCRSYTATGELAKEIAQDVFLEAIHSVHALASDETPLAVWLCGIARTTMARHGVWPYPSEAGSSPLVREEFIDAEVLGQLRTLPHDWRAVLELRFVVGLSVPEAAAAMGSSPDALRALEERGLEAFAAASRGDARVDAPADPRHGTAA